MVKKTPDEIVGKYLENKDGAKPESVNITISKCGPGVVRQNLHDLRAC